MPRRIVLVTTLLVGVLGFPRTSHAGLLDLIWELSGPQMLGIGYGCYFTKTLKTDHCRFGSLALALAEQQREQQKLVEAGKRPELTLGDRWAFGLGGSLFGSTGKDGDSNVDGEKRSYKPGEIWILAFEPAVQVRYNNPPGAAKPPVIYSWGAGISYDRVFGFDIKPFDKFAITVTPFEAAWERWAVGAKFRLYPNGFTNDELKPGPHLDFNRPFEATFGVSVSYIIKCKC